MSNLWLQIKNFFRNLWLGTKTLRSLRRQQLPQILENLSKKEFYAILATLLVIVLSGGFLIFQIFSELKKQFLEKKRISKEKELINSKENTATVTEIREYFKSNGKE